MCLVKMLNFVVLILWLLTFLSTESEFSTNAAASAEATMACVSQDGTNLGPDTAHERPHGSDHVQPRSRVRSPASRRQLYVFIWAIMLGFFCLGRVP
jgi:hypothetical protein